MKRPVFIATIAGFVIWFILVLIVAAALVSNYSSDVAFNSTGVVIPAGNPAVETAISLTQTAKAATDTPIPTPNNLDPRFLGQDINLNPINVGLGEGKLSLNIKLPDGYDMNDQAPFTLHIYNNDLVSVTPKNNDLKITLPKMPVVVPITLKAGQSTLIMDTRVYYCEAVNTTMCYPARLRLIAPLSVSNNGNPNISIDYLMVVPKDG